MHLEFDDVDPDEYSGLPKIKHVSHPHATLNRKPVSPKSKKGKSVQVIEPVQAQVDEMRMSYHASRHEHEWLLGSLEIFYEQQWFDDVLRLIKGGKEASVYLCAANASVGMEYLAAKVYRPRRFRSLKNDHFYQEGRSRLDQSGNLILDDGMNHAMDKRTQYGLELLHGSWIEHEFQTMRILHEAGADTPIPLERGNNVILMSYVGEAESPAPTLNTIDLSRQEAQVLFERVLHNIEVMLDHNRVHADLSAYNILYWDGDITLIDFPQAINPDENNNAYMIFQRDITRVCEYFARQGVSSKPVQIARSLWQARNRRITPQLDPRFLDDQSEADRMIWNNRD